jgi:hypothetical protein
MAAPETPATVDTTDTRARGACLTTGCVCKDARILSYRRAAFFAVIAQARGETASRIVLAEPEWRIGVA